MTDHLRWMARSLRFSMVTAFYQKGDLTREEAIELLSGPLSPDDPSSVYDDSNLIDNGKEGLKIIQESEGIPYVEPGNHSPI